MPTKAELFHQQNSHLVNCPICKTSGNMHWLVDAHGELLVERHYVFPINSPTIRQGGVALGGSNFLSAFKLCHYCGHMTTFNLTLSNDDPAVPVP